MTTSEEDRRRVKINFPLKAISSNSAYPTGRNGRRYLTGDGVAFKRSVAYLLVGKVPWKAKKEDRFSAIINFRFKDKRRRDIDDYFKLFLDALTDAGVWLDDSQIVELYGAKAQGCDTDEIEACLFKI